MSYKTNPILNRIKINKGWKNPYFPTKTLNYSRDISLWFKVYLILKFFLNWKKIQLVSFEIRFDEKNKKILYLKINKKVDRRKKRKKKKLALNKVLNKIQTPMLKKINEGAIFFLYKNLSACKRGSFWNQNLIQKKIFSKFWLTKPKTFTWLNTLEKIARIRRKTKNIVRYTQKQKNFLPIRHLKLKLHTQKQKQILAQIAKIQKKHRVFSLHFFALLQLKNQKILQRFIKNFQKDIANQKIQIQKLNQMYNFLFSSVQTRPGKKKVNLLGQKKILTDSIQRKKLNLFWKNFKRQSNSFCRIAFLKKALPGLILNLKKKQVKAFSPYNSVLSKQDTILKKVLHLNFLVAQISRNAFLFRNYFLSTRFSSKFRLRTANVKKKWQRRLNTSIHSFFRDNLQKKKRIPLKKKKRALKLYYPVALWIALRTAKKKKRKGSKFQIFRKKFRRKLSRLQKRLLKKVKFKSYKQYTRFLAKNKFVQKTKRKRLYQDLKKINWTFHSYRIARYYRYRLPYRKMHFSFRQLQTNFQFKYLIQDLVQKYFFVQVEAKILHVLNARKNTNFFRLAFSVRKKKRTLAIRKIRVKSWSQKKIFLASRLKLVTVTKKKKKRLLKKKTQRKNLFLKWIQRKKNVSQTLGKKDRILLSEKKRLKWRQINSFSRITKGKDFRSTFKYLIPTLMEFLRSFNPQLLADVLAKVVKKSKKQTWMLNTIKYLLQAIQLPKNVGYKIVLSGRINSKNKSRLIYITNKQITLQVFQNPMNFAYAQANARIGAFGVKIWVYSKKKLAYEKNYSLTSKY